MRKPNSSSSTRAQTAKRKKPKKASLPKWITKKGSRVNYKSLEEFDNFELTAVYERKKQQQHLDVP